MLRTILVLLLIQKSSQLHYQLFNCAESPNCIVFNVLEVKLLNKFLTTNDFVENIYGPNINFTEIQSVTFVNSRFQEVPSTIFERLVNLKALDISQTGVILSIDSFTEAQNLENLKLGGNQIEKLEDSMLNRLPNLKELDLSNNQLNEIPEKMFENCCQNLEILNLCNNSIVVLGESSFSKFTNLKELDLSWNQIETIQGTFENCCQQLEKLDLSHNKIQEVAEENFSFFKKRNTYRGRNPTVPSKTQLNLNQNQLENFQCNFVVDELNLAQNNINDIVLSSCNVKQLDVSDNRLEMIALNPYITVLYIQNNKINDVTCSDGSNLMDVNFSGNNLSKDSFKCLSKNVTVLDFSKNNLGPLDSQTFSGFNCFQTLILQQTQITTIEYGTFNSQTSLQCLDLSGNYITTLNLNLFEFCGQMQKFYCGGNQIFEIQNVQYIRVYMKRIQVIEISGNRWTCSYLEKLLAALKQQNVRVYVVNPVMNGPNVNGIACQDSKSTYTTATQTTRTTTTPRTTTLRPSTTTVNYCQQPRDASILLRSRFENIKVRLTKLSVDLSRIQNELEETKNLVDQYLLEL